MSGTMGIITIVGANGNTYISSSGNNTMFGSVGGDDTLSSGGTDVVYLGSGNDTVFASGPSATINPGVGSLLFVAGSGDYVLNIDPSSFDGQQTIFGGSGNDRLSAGNGNSILVAGSGNTTLFGGSRGADILYGGSGRDTLNGLPIDTLIGGTGNTLFSSGTLEFGGLATSDYFQPFGATVVEGNGNEQVDIGEFGSATVFGGKGLDTYYLNNNPYFSDPDYVPEPTSIIGFKPGDVVAYNLESGTSLSTALATEVKGSFGSTVELNGASITFFGHIATAADFLNVTKNLT